MYGEQYLSGPEADRKKPVIKGFFPLQELIELKLNSNIKCNVQAEIHGVDITINQTCIKMFNIHCPDNKDLSLHNFDVPQENCIVLGDLNSHSTCWGYEANNARGDEIEDWQSETDMELINDPDDPPTFYSRRWMTTSTPDLAFASGNLANKIQRNVTTQPGGSDHRPMLLTMDLEWKQKDEKTFPRWNHKKSELESLFSTHKQIQ